MRSEPKLIIFDCDGVLVDSEIIATGLLHERIRSIGGDMSIETVCERFLGQTEASTLHILADEFNLVLPVVDREQWRTRLIERFREHLLPIKGIRTAVETLTIPKCVASSSSPERIEFALELTGLIDLFKPHLFSGTAVQHGKPAPDLFLHASQKMGMKPETALVIEDSPAGIIAAKTAGMRVFAFIGGSHMQSERMKRQITDLSPDVVFDDMNMLPSLLSG
ncbi:HAD family hydrolase [Pararhizobium sp. PWRC1-1]|uniref:HAD family hydrolase n=1 Tax=Pararhizobium sp. PWRC1-1 TaxID=2804566 RepID=UPI003CEF0311